MNPTAMDGEVRSDNLESHCGVDIWKLSGRLGDLLRESHGRLGNVQVLNHDLIQLLLSYTAVGARKGLLCGHLWIQIPGHRLSL